MTAMVTVVMVTSGVHNVVNLYADIHFSLVTDWLLLQTYQTWDFGMLLRPT